MPLGQCTHSLMRAMGSSDCTRTFTNGSADCQAGRASAYCRSIAAGFEGLNDMANGDLDVVIRQLAKQQHKGLLAAAKKQRDRYASLAAKAKDKPARDRFRQLAKDTMEHAAAAARRLQISADNAADSFARSMRQAAAEQADKAEAEKARAAKAAEKKAMKTAANAKPKAKTG